MKILANRFFKSFLWPH